MNDRDLLVVAGEVSGDLHAARLVRALAAKRPGLRVFGLGSSELRAAGADLLADSREIAVVGIVEALSVLSRAREIFARLLAEVERRRPAVAVLVDFPEFNLRLARELKWRGVRVVYYVSPQVWAWRRWRVRTIAESVDRMLVFFPFETAFYERAGVAVTHVGHPLVDDVPQLPQAWEGVAPVATPGRFNLALLPGSRRSELSSLLPLMIASASLLASRLPIAVRLIRAPSIDLGAVPELVASHPGLDLEIIDENRFEAIASSHLALCASGTATLETGLLGTPLVVLYRLSRWTWYLAQLLVRVPHASLVNLVLGKRAVPELLQDEARADRVADEMAGLLGDRSTIDGMRRELGRLRGLLGASGASERAADAVLEVLEQNARAA